MTGVRRQLATHVAVAMALVLVAFLVPLGLVLRGSAMDRAIAAANDTAQTTAAVIAADPATTRNVAGLPSEGLAVSVFLPDGTVVGRPAARTASIELASRGRAFTASSGAGVEALVPVQGMQGGTAVVRAYAPPSLLRAGVARTWAVLVLLGLALLGLGLLLADRLGRRLVGSVVGLAATADRLSHGELDARVTPDGPRELRRVGAELNRLAGRIAELLTAEREEVADLAHRLRTPVTALRLDTESVADPAERERLAAGVDQLTRVIDEVIRTARRPQREGAGVSVDLAATVAERLAFWAPLAEDDGRPVQVDVPAFPVGVRCAADDLAAAVDALVQNVFAHTPEGAGMHVSVAARPGGGGVLTIADEGPGFTVAAAERGASSGDSTGLGLDIARRTAQAAGGELRVSPGPERGAVVTLTFAAPDAGTAPAGSGVTVREAGRSTTPKRSRG